MPLSIDTFNKLILVTSPTTEVDAQTLHDFVEDFMASPEGLLNDGTWSLKGEILAPEGSGRSRLLREAGAQAMRLGISCYTQKPLTRTIYEARLLAKVAEETGVCTQRLCWAWHPSSRCVACRRSRSRLRRPRRRRRTHQEENP